MRQMRCTVSEIAIAGSGFGRRIGEGAIVDFDEALAPGLTIAGAVQGREDCFTPLAPEPAAPVRPTTRKAAAPPEPAPDAAKE